MGGGCDHHGFRNGAGRSIAMALFDVSMHLTIVILTLLMTATSAFLIWSILAGGLALLKLREQFSFLYVTVLPVKHDGSFSALANPAKTHVLLDPSSAL